MKTKANLNKRIDNKYINFPRDSSHSINNVFNLNKTISNFISSKDLINNIIKKEYKLSFIQKNTISGYISKNDKKENSKQNLGFKIKEKISNDNETKKENFQTKLIKEVKFNLEKKNIIHKNNSNQKPDFIKKKILNRIENSKILFNEEKHNQANKNITNSIKLNLNNKSKCSYSKNFFKNRNSKKNQYHINIKNCYSKEKEPNHNQNTRITIENNNKKLKLSYLNLNKKSENKKLKKNIQISDMMMKEDELKVLSKRRTFIESDKSFIKKSYYMHIKLPNDEENQINKINIDKKQNNNYIATNSYGNDMNKYVNNKRKKKLKNIKNTLYFTSFIDKMILKSCNNIDLYNPKKEQNNANSLRYKAYNTEQNLKLKNNDIKNNKSNINKITKYACHKKEKKEKIESKNDRLYNVKLEQKMKPKKKEKPKNIYIPNKNEFNTEEINYVLDIESEHKNEIHLIKTNNFYVKKPKEINMKFTLLKELEDDEDNKNINKSQIENIIIGKIDGYKDIIESDELKKKLELKSKSSFEIGKKRTKKLEKKNEGDNKNFKNFSNKKTSFMTMHILDDSSSEIEDLDFDRKEFHINDRIINIENGYEFEDMTTFENETKINNENKLFPFPESKISFCKYYDKNDVKYKTNENKDTDKITLAEINKELDEFNNKNSDLKNEKDKNLQKNNNKNKFKNSKLKNTNKNNLPKKDIYENKEMHNCIKKCFTYRKRDNDKDKNYIMSNHKLTNEYKSNKNINKKI